MEGSLGDAFDGEAPLALGHATLELRDPGLEVELASPSPSARNRRSRRSWRVVIASSGSAGAVTGLIRCEMARHRSTVVSTSRRRP